MQTLARPRQTPLRYMPQLDGLRALAAFGVLAQHFLDPSNLFAATIPLGDLGVRLFFVLSGFLITAILLGSRAGIERDSISRAAVIRNFFARRLLRLVPLYFVFLTLMFVFLPDVRPLAPWFFSYLQNVHFALEGEFTVAPHLWTLAVEEQFYLIWPMLILFLPRRWLFPAVVAVAALGVVSRIALVAAGLSHFQVSMLTPAHFDTLAVGALLAVAAHSGRFAYATLERYLRLAALAGVVLLGSVLGSKLAGWPSTFELVVAELGAGLLFVWIIGIAAGRGVGGLAGRFIACAPLVYLGKISYGIYVLHWFVPASVAWLAGVAGFSLPINEWLRFTLFSTVSIAAAAMSWHALEAPVLQLKRFFSYRHADGRRRTRAAAPAR